MSSANAAGIAAVEARAATRSTVAGRLALPALLVLATLVRLPDLAGRGPFDADQGRDLLALRAMLVDGNVPLLGPVASIGDFHHGAIYYYLLALPAWLSGLDPTAVAGLFALAGIVGVGLVWWLARAVAGPIAGFAAGLVYALSPGAVAASVTIWNPDLVGTAAILALACAWQAWRRRDARWWVAALAALGLTVALHVVSALPAVAILLLLLADARRTAPGAARRRLAVAVSGGLVLAALWFVPLLVHEVGTGFSELRSVLAFLHADRGATGAGPLERLLIVGVRMVSFPVTGLVTDAPAAAAIASGAVLAGVAWRLAAARDEEAVAVRWLAGVLAVTAVGLALLAPDAARVVIGLPNDHYHAATDPIVAVVIGVAIAGLARWRERIGRPLAVGAAVAVAVGVLAVEVVRLPPADPDGGWPAAATAARRVTADVPAPTLLVVGLPDFKPTGQLIFPLLQADRAVLDGSRAAEGAQAPDLGRPATGHPDALVVVCDRLFEPVIGLACGGPAEGALSHPEFPRLVDRFDLSPRTSVSVYGRASGVGP